MCELIYDIKAYIDWMCYVRGPTRRVCLEVQERCAAGVRPTPLLDQKHIKSLKTGKTPNSGAIFSCVFTTFISIK